MTMGLVSKWIFQEPFIDVVSRLLARRNSVGRGRGVEAEEKKPGELKKTAQYCRVFYNCNSA